MTICPLCGAKITRADSTYHALVESVWVAYHLQCKREEWKRERENNDHHNDCNPPAGVSMS